MKKLTNIGVIKSKRSYYLNIRHVKSPDAASEKNLTQENDDKNYSKDNTQLQDLF